MFYGSFDPATAIQETYKLKDGRSSVATIGKFRPLRELQVLDLTSLPDIPSIFDEHRGHLHSTIIFLQSFVDDLSKPIEKDDRTYIEYVPTQVFTEFIRHAYRLENDSRLEGIVYPSSVNPSGGSCVLFVGNDECCDNGTEERKWKPYKLVLEDIERQKIA